MRLSDRLFMRGSRYLHRIGIIENPDEKTKPWRGDVSKVPQCEKTKTPMHQAFYEGREIHKWHNYPDIYHKYFERFRGKKFRMLEIGVHKGGSLELWRKYFGPDAIIFGIDIDPDCAKLDGQAGQVRIGSQDDPTFLRKVVTEMGGIDVVLDDGSHVADHQRVSFDILFPLLNDHGIYLCEDTHTAYWRGFYAGGYKRKTNFLETAKNIVDDIHADFHGRGETVPGASRSISGLHFYNSIVVIEKDEQNPPTHYQL
jgi:hypothetical protein